MHNNCEINRNERRRQVNMELSNLQTFTPLNDYQIYHINRATSTMLLPHLIESARKTTKFTVDTEHDYYTRQPALIQIEFIQTKSIILLIETCHLPRRSSVLFWLIQSLFKAIFKPSNTIYSWGDAIFELSDFLQYDLFSSQILHQIMAIDIQQHFKKWYNKIFTHDCGLLPFADDNMLCKCSHRPVKRPDDQWSLQKAIAYTFDEFLDKTRTKSRWGLCLDLANAQQFAIINKKQRKIIEELVVYAANDCLAVTKLVLATYFM
jgi:hypothetical protein